MLEEALIYLSMGWSVYPAHSVNMDGSCTCGNPECPTPGKHPMGRWSDFQNRLPTKHEVEKMFGKMDCNVGTVTGRISGIAVVDLDGSEGIESARKLGLASTLTAKTGGGGLHYYYSIVELGSVPSKVRVVPGIDIRGDGGYVILPPSIHRSGKRYEWVEPCRMALFNPEPFARNDRFSSARSGTNWYDVLLQGVDMGSRSVSAARLAGRYFTLGMTAKEVWLLMSAWNERNRPPLDESDLLRTVNGVRRKHESEFVPAQITTYKEIRDLLEGVANGRT